MRRDFLRILMPEVIFNADRIGQIKSFLDQDVRGHNRWHRGVPATAAVGPSIPAASSLFKCRLRTDGGQEQPQRCRQAEPERKMQLWSITRFSNWVTSSFSWAQRFATQSWPTRRTGLLIKPKTTLSS